jgi:oligopeptide/dipeptide ABC transporter ATP-binding protein
VASDIHVEFPGTNGPVKAATSISLSVDRGATLGVVGESGCGKSITLRALAGLVPQPGRMCSGTVEVDGTVFRSARELEKVRGSKMSMIFQDPASSLNPVMTIGAQVSEVLRVTRGAGRRRALREAAQLLDHVGIPQARERLRSYPHELSGGMRQRVMIAMAIACRPMLLLADEPTTALDVTTQEQILRLLQSLQAEFGMAVILVSHDLGVIEEVCDQIVVMYAGYIVERQDVSGLASRACHPYTRGLIDAMPRIDSRSLPEAIPGQPPDLGGEISGCPFQPRCAKAVDQCLEFDMDNLTRLDCACPIASGQLGQ